MHEIQKYKLRTKFEKTNNPPPTQMRKALGEYTMHEIQKQLLRTKLKEQKRKVFQKSNSI